MLSRRNLRIKVMHLLYANEMDAVSDVEHLKKNLEKSITKSYDLVKFNLALLVRVANLVQKEGALRASKLLPNKEDLNFNTQLAENPIIVRLIENKPITAILKLSQSEEEKEMVKAFFKTLMDKNEYQEYCNDDDSGEKEMKIIKTLYDKVIVKNDQYKEYVEENYPECINDLSKINQFIEGIILNPQSLNTASLFDESEIKNEKKFAIDLLEKTFAHKEELTELIAPKLQNWDIDRIAQLDMILMKMALCELLYFEQIPVKVSINEYIDISKIYSTAKSKDFINGILDKVMHELKSEGKIKKIGRGMVE